MHPPDKTPPRPQERRQPLFWTVTGRDFGRSIAWAKRTPNKVTARIREYLSLPTAAAAVNKKNGSETPHKT